jgi:hypothetical protein
VVAVVLAQVQTMAVAALVVQALLFCLFQLQITPAQQQVLQQ